jgi:hypothetical protein
MFDDGRSEKLEALRGIAAGHSVLSAVLIDCVEQALGTGKIWREALHDAAHSALLDQAARDVRTIEEHYLRESTANKATQMRDRMLEGVSMAPIRELAGQLIDQHVSVARVPPRHGGLDDGVRL